MGTKKHYQVNPGIIYERGMKIERENAVEQMEIKSLKFDADELSFARRDLDSDWIGKYAGLQFSTTGVFGYSFRDEFNNEVVTVSSQILLRPDIQITAFGRKLWHRQFDTGITLVPGIHRTVEDERGKTVAYFEYEDMDTFRICVQKKQILCVRLRPEGWVISDANDTVVALIKRLSEDERTYFIENGLDMVECFLVEALNDIDELMLPFICTVPVLGF